MELTLLDVLIKNYVGKAFMVLLVTIYNSCQLGTYITHHFTICW